MKYLRYLESTGRVKKLREKTESFLDAGKWVEDTVDYEADANAFMKEQGKFNYFLIFFIFFLYFMNYFVYVVF